jgi:transposase
MTPARVYVGIDWGNESHRAWMTDPAGAPLGDRTFVHRSEGLAALADWVGSASGGDAAAVVIAIEVPRGTVVETLLERGFHVWALNPKQLDRFRDRYAVAGAKDDRRDARVLAHAARTDPAAFHPVAATDPVTAQLRECSRHDAELAEDLGRAANRLRDLLLRAWPELLVLVPAANEPWLWALLALAPAPDIASRLRPASVRALLRRHHIRRLTAEEVVAVLRGPQVYLVPGTREGIAIRVRDLVAQLAMLQRQRAHAEQQLARLLAPPPDAPPQDAREHRDAEILQSLPGLGTRIAGTMLAEAAAALRRRDYHALRAQTGIAPVTKQSGKSRVVHMRLACNGRLQHAMYCWGQGAVRLDPHTRAHYARLRTAGHGHARALRGVGDRLLRLLVVLLTTGACYDPDRRSAPPEAA